MYSANDKGNKQASELLIGNFEWDGQGQSTGRQRGINRPLNRPLNRVFQGSQTPRPKKREPRGSINQNAKHGKKTRCCRNPWHATIAAREG